MPFPDYFHRPDIDNFVLVFTMGKVGSTALVRSLEAVNLFTRQLQWATPETQTFMDRSESIKPGTRENRLLNLQTRINTRRACLALRDPDYASMLKVIAVIRNPIEQVLSHYFHAAIYEKEFELLGIEVTPGNVRAALVEAAEWYMIEPKRTLADLTARLDCDSPELTRFAWLVHNYLYWFDQEFRVFFPEKIIGGQMEDGYQIVGNALILRFEQIATVGERVVATYVQRPHFKMLRDNVGADKSYGELYREVLAMVRFPRAFVDHLCDAPYVRHFYSQAERQAMRDRWTA
jgi:Putative capsular polysaccharide synthesis protein